MTTEPTTATDPNGVVHTLAGPDLTACGERATGWSRAVTELQQIGLILFCSKCEQESGS